MDINSNYFIRNHSNFNRLYYKKESNNLENKISNSRILNTIRTPNPHTEFAHRIRTPNSHTISHQKGSDSKKPAFSVTRFFSNNKRTVNLIAGIGFGTLVLGLIYRSLGTTFASSFPAYPGISPSSPESPDTIGTCPSIWLPRLGASTPSNPANTFLNDPSLRLEELLRNPSRLLKSKSDSPIFIPPEQINRLLPFQDRLQNTPRLLLSTSDLPISITLEQPSGFSFSQVTNLPYKHLNLVKGLCSLFSAPNSKSQDLSQNFPRIHPSYFAPQIFNVPTPVDKPLYDFSSSNPATEFQGLSIDQTVQRFFPSQPNDKISVPIPLNRTNERLRTLRKIHALQKFLFSSRNIYPSFPTNSTLTSKKQGSIATLISKEHHKFNLINLKPQDPLSILKSNHFRKGFTPTYQTSSKRDSISVNAEREIKIAKTNTTVYQTYISPMITHGIHGYEWTLDKIYTVSEYTRTALGVPKYLWNPIWGLLFKPLKSLPFRKIAAYLTPVAMGSYYYGSFLLRMGWPTIRRFLPENIRDRIDGKTLAALNAAPQSGGSNTPSKPLPQSESQIYQEFRLPPNVRNFDLGANEDVTKSGLL